MVRFKRIYVIMAIAFIAMSFNTGGDAGTEIDLTPYASDYLISKCDSIKQGFREFPDSLDLFPHAELTLKDQENIVVNGNNYCAMVIGCIGYGEVVLLDSCWDTQTYLRQGMNIPGEHVNFEDIIDINNDGNDEIIIYLSGGAHGYYAYFLSVYEDSLSFIENEDGYYGFFAIRGGIHVKDLDEDGISEIIVDGMIRENQKENYTVYKWNGKEYSVHKRVER